MANQYTPKIKLNVRGTNLIISKLRSSNEDLSQAQYIAGTELGVFFTGEAYRIIRTLSPKSKGDLASSVTHNTIKAQGGWRTKIFTPLTYGAVVEGGGPAETKRVDAALQDWYQRVTGRSPRIGSYVTVRKGNNPMYNTAMGMGFFRTPFTKNQQKIIQTYQAKVNKALYKLNVRYY